MPSQKPRVAITIEPELLASLEGLAAAMEKPLATVIVFLLLEAQSSIDGMAKMIRATRAGNKAAAKQALAHMIGDTAAEMMTASQPELFSKKARKR